MIGVEAMQAPNLESIMEQTKARLVQLCQVNGLKKTGTKGDLQKRLLQHFGFSDEASLVVVRSSFNTI